MPEVTSNSLCLLGCTSGEKDRNSLHPFPFPSAEQLVVWAMNPDHPNKLGQPLHPAGNWSVNPGVSQWVRGDPVFAVIGSGAHM